jgi:hypothetical protein
LRYLILTLALTGCVTSPVVKLDEGNYLVSVHTVFGLNPPRGLKAKAADEADEYCAQSGKTAHIKNWFGTGLPPFSTLSGDVVFTCIAPETPGGWQ